MTPYLIGFILGLFAALALLAVFYTRYLRQLAEGAAAKERLGFLETQLAAAETRAADLTGRLQAESASRVAAETEAKRISALETECQKLREASESLRAANSKFEADLAHEKTASLEKLALLEDARAKLGDAFQALSAQALQASNQSFLELAKTSLGQFQTEAKGDLAAREKAIGDLLKPINDQLGDFKTSIAKAMEEAGKERHGLQTEVATLSRLNQTISAEAKNLAGALKGSNKIQGDWGEMILEHLLEASGIAKGTGFSVQRQYESEEDKRGKPEVILNLPGNRCLIVDSKVSIDAYVAHCSTEEPVERQAHLKRHLESVRSHIDGLSKRDYRRLEGLKGTLDFVVMFVPVEPAFLLAISQDESLFMEAWKKNVLLASPSTLLYVLRIVDHLWRQENQARNAREIADRGAKLYDKFQTFVSEFLKIGAALEAARKSYTSSFDYLSTGRGNLVGQAEKLRELGVKPSKSLPQALIDRSADETALIEDSENPAG
ncbi:MAG: DNA recombination protein RmuC [Spartobacteria bacterium]